MLELTRPFGAPVRPFLSAWVACQLAREPWQERGYWQLRREVFCRETGLFPSETDERDAHDAHALPIVALAHSAGSPDDVVGVVRIYEAESSVWYGGRLAVAPVYRLRPAVGASLIACAVTSAVERGCQRFLATVLAVNASYFARHGFRAHESVELCGRPHLLMEAELGRFAPGRASPDGRAECTTHGVAAPRRRQCAA